MKFGVVLQTNPPAWRTVQLAELAEAHGFDYVWTFDSHLLWQEPYVIYSQILAGTNRVIVGPMVTNPATRDWTVTASVFATLNEMYGNRTVCGIGRGDSAVRVTNGKPAHPQGDPRGHPCDPGARQLPAGGLQGSHPAVPLGRTSALEVWVAAYGPLALKTAGEVGDGFILQLADVDIAAWMIKAVRTPPPTAGRDPEKITSASRPPTTSATTGRTCATSAAGSAAWSATTWPTSWPSTANRSGAAGPDRLHQGPAGLRLQRARPAGNTHTAFVPDEIVDRFCLLGTAEDHIAKLKQLKEIGVDQFAGLPPARQQGGDSPRLRRDDHARAAGARRRATMSRGYGDGPAQPGPRRPRADASWRRPGSSTRRSDPRKGSWSPAGRFCRGPVTGRCRTSGRCSPGCSNRPWVSRAPPLWQNVVEAAASSACGIAAVGWLLGVVVGLGLACVMRGCGWPRPQCCPGWC